MRRKKPKLFRFPKKRGRKRKRLKFKKQSLVGAAEEVGKVIGKAKYYYVKYKPKRKKSIYR